VIEGLITTEDVLQNAALIVELFGWVVWLRALRACFSSTPTTFLACLYPEVAR